MPGYEAGAGSPGLMPLLGRQRRRRLQRNAQYKKRPYSRAGAVLRLRDTGAFRPCGFYSRSIFRGIIRWSVKT